MTSARYDSVLISLDWISFRYFFRRELRAYLVVISADTNGTIGIYESPESYSVLHRPMRDKPATIDFGFDGFVIYSSAGAVPDLVRFDVFVVKEHAKGRRVGALQKALESSRDLEAKVRAARTAVASASSGGSTASAVATAVAPVLDMVGGMVADLDDKVIEAYSGSKIFDVALVSKGDDEKRKTLQQTVVSPTGNIETKVDITLFQRQATSTLSNEDAPLGADDGSDPGDAPPDGTRPELPPRADPEAEGEVVIDAERDPESIAISLRRPRALFHVGWLASLLVPGGLLIGALSAESSPALGRVLLAIAMVSAILSPALLYGAGHWGRARTGRRSLTRLGWVSVVFHGIGLVFIGLGIWIVADAINDPKEGFDAIGQLFAAVIGAVLMAMISLVPWLVSVITAIVFARRMTRP